MQHFHTVVVVLLRDDHLHGGSAGRVTLPPATHHHFTAQSQFPSTSITPNYAINHPNQLKSHKESNIRAKTHRFNLKDKGTSTASTSTNSTPPVAL